MLSFALGLAAVVASAQAAKSRSRSRGGIPGPHPDVQTTHNFIGASADGLRVKEQLRPVCGFVNNGDSPLNLTYIFGSLNDPANFGTVMHSLGSVKIHDIVEPGAEVTLEYPFIIPGVPDYPARFRLALTLIYEDDAGEVYGNTFINETVTFIEPSRSFSIEDSLPTILGGLAVILFAYLALEATPFLADRMERLNVQSIGPVAAVAAADEDLFDEDSLNIKVSKKGNKSA